jgi:hypothetical protein
MIVVGGDLGIINDLKSKQRGRMSFLKLNLCENFPIIKTFF